MTDADQGPLGSLADLANPVFLKWEKLRIPYNLILLVVLILFHGIAMGTRFFHPLALLFWLAGAVAANLCFLAAPLAETYIAWLGLRSHIVTAVLFAGGVLVSIPCVLLFSPLAFFGVYID